MRLPTEAIWARIRRAAEASRHRPGYLDRRHRPKPSPGLICPYMKTPWGERFRCFVHRDAQAQADNDYICRKLCLPRGGPFKQTIRPRGIPTGGRLPVDLRGLNVDAWKRPSAPSPGQMPPRVPVLRTRRYGRKVA